METDLSWLNTSANTRADFIEIFDISSVFVDKCFSIDLHFDFFFLLNHLFQENRINWIMLLTIF